MEYLIGIGLAGVRLRDVGRILIETACSITTLATVIATYYILFAVMGSSTSALMVESVIAAAFFALAVAGFKKNLWLVVAALAGHAVFDFFHHRFIQNPGVPARGAPDSVFRSTFSLAVSLPCC